HTRKATILRGWVTLSRSDSPAWPTPRRWRGTGRKCFATWASCPTSCTTRWWKRLSGRWTSVSGPASTWHGWSAPPTTPTRSWRVQGSNCGGCPRDPSPIGASRGASFRTRRGRLAPGEPAIGQAGVGIGFPLDEAAVVLEQPIAIAEKRLHAGQVVGDDVRVVAEESRGAGLGRVLVEQHVDQRRAADRLERVLELVAVEPIPMVEGPILIEDEPVQVHLLAPLAPPGFFHDLVGEPGGDAGRERAAPGETRWSGIAHDERLAHGLDIEPRHQESTRVDSQVEPAIVELPGRPEAGELREAEHRAALQHGALLDERLGRQGESPTASQQRHPGMLQGGRGQSLDRSSTRRTADVLTANHFPRKLRQCGEGVV